jgi:nucleoside-diphosphate-sugar epimerase
MHLAREVILTDVCRAADVPAALLRPSLLYGPGDTHDGYGPNRFVRLALAGDRIDLFGEGEERRDHVFVADLAALVGVVIGRGSTGLLNVATGRAASFREVAETVVSLVPEPVAIEGSPRRNPITHRHFDVDAAREALPAFRWTPLREGLERSVRGWPTST